MVWSERGKRDGPLLFSEAGSAELLLGRRKLNYFVVGVRPGVAKIQSSIGLTYIKCAEAQRRHASVELKFGLWMPARSDVIYVA
ncbi:hypothetical protein TNCV_357321 [Trichonephila clavipes]|nr:hypothetical protein TNCV_357321 [Trichonephila clavipes]